MREAKIKQRIVSCIYAATLSILALNAKAEQTDDSLFELSLEDLISVPVSVASAQAKDIFNTPSTVSVITADMIEKYNFQTVAEAVNTVAGFSIVRTGARIEIPTGRWVLQDHYPNKVLFMINGVPSWETNTGATTLGHVSPQDVERIEVLKGPASVLYGTNAFVGAINVILKKESSGMIYGGPSEYNGIRGGGNVSIIDGDTSLFFSANYYDEDGSSESITDAEGNFGYYSDFRNYSNLSIVASHKTHHFLFNTYSERQSKLGKDPTFADALGKPQELYGYVADYHNDFQINKRLDITAGLSYDYNQRVFPRAAIVAAAAPQFSGDIPTDEDLVSDVEGYRTSVYAKGFFNYSDSINIDFGIDYDERTNLQYRSYNTTTGTDVSNNNMKGRSIYEYSGYGQVEYTKGPATYLIGSRITDNQLFGSDTSSRATLVYLLNRTNSIKFNIGQSFRAPSLFEVYFLNDSKSVNGNPDIDPERNTTVELAYLTKISDLFVQAVIYHAVYKDRIYRKTYNTAEFPTLVLTDGTLLGDTNRSSTKVYENGDEFSADGLELELNYHFPGGSLFTSYNYVDGDDGDDIGDGNYNFKYPPSHKLVSAVNVRISAATLSTVYTYYSKMQSVTDTIGSQNKLDVNLAFEHAMSGHRIRHIFSIKNLTDEEIIGPDYVDREETFPTLRWDQSRRASYTLSINF